jgi:hypothetical protein
VRLNRPGLRISQSRNGYYANGGQQPQNLSGKTSSTVPVNMNVKPVKGQAPVLLTPIAQALLSSLEKSDWRFSWESVPGATQYQIVINAPDRISPVLEIGTRGAHYVLNKKVVHASRELKGWSWKVRSRSADGAWGPWSEPRPFDVFE